MAVATATAIGLAATAAKAWWDHRQQKKQQEALEKSKAQGIPLSAAGQKAQTGMFGLAGEQQTQGQNFLAQGTDALKRSSSYYYPLLTGNRGAIDQALAPETGAITDQYRGASKNLDRAGVHGAGRDVAEAELGRDRVGKLATLRPQARANAAAQVSQQGQFQINAGQNAYGQAGGLLSSIYGGERGSSDNNQSSYLTQLSDMRRQQEASGRSTGALLFNILDTYGNRGGNRTQPSGGGQYSWLTGGGAG